MAGELFSKHDKISATHTPNTDNNSDSTIRVEYRVALKRNPNNTQILYELASLIRLQQLKAESSDFPDGIVPATRPKQIAKLYRRILAIEKNRTDVWYELACMIISDAIQAQDSDFPDIVIPKGRSQQSAKLFRLILDLQPNHLRAKYEILSLIHKRRIRAETTDEVTFAQSSYHQRKAVLYRLELLINPHNCKSRIELARLILQGQVKSEGADFENNVIPQNIFLQAAALLGHNLKLNPNHLDSRFELAFLIHFKYVDALATDFVDKIMPNNYFLQAAKLYRYILTLDPEHGKARFYLAELIVGGEVKAEAADFPDGVVPENEFTQALKLFRVILQSGPSKDLLSEIEKKADVIVYRCNTTLLSNFACYVFLMVLISTLGRKNDELQLLCERYEKYSRNKYPNEFIDFLLKDSVFSEQDKVPYYKSMYEYNRKLTPQNRGVLNSHLRKDVVIVDSLLKSCRKVTYPYGVAFFGRMIDKADGVAKTHRVQWKEESQPESDQPLLNLPPNVSSGLPAKGAGSSQTTPQTGRGSSIP